MKRITANLRLVDGSVHETVFDSNIENPKEYLEESIIKNTLVKVIHPRYRELFGEEFIVGKHIISFRIFESSAD